MTMIGARLVGPACSPRLGAAVVVVGRLAEWWSVGGNDGLPVAERERIRWVRDPRLRRRPGDDRAGHVAVRDGPPVERGSLAGLRDPGCPGWISLLVRVVDLAALRAFTFSEPAEVFTRSPGLWVTGLGLLMLTRAAYEAFREPPTAEGPA